MYCIEKFRAKALQSLASAMAQLNRFMLDHGGSIVFDSNDRAVDVEGAKFADANAMWYRKDDDPGDNDIFCEKGPFTDPKAALLFMLDRRPSQPTDTAYLKGIYVLLRMFIEWAYERKSHGPRSVLAHPDLDIQNVLVAEDGTLRGLIDWDGAAAVPREVGAAQYPFWLMHDWIESQYDYNIEDNKPRAEAGYDESSPDELSCYRAMYAQFMEQEIRLNSKDSADLTIYGTTPKEEADITRRSLVMKNLDIATSSHIVAADVVHHMLALIVDLTEADWEDGESDCDSSSSTDSHMETEASLCDVEDIEDAVVENISDGISRSNSEDHDCIDNDKGSTDTKSTETVNPDESLVTDDAAYHLKNDVVSTHASLNEPSNSNGAESREQVTISPAENVCQKLNSSCLSWTRKMLRSGCNAAEKILRRIAKIGHVNVLHDAVDESTQSIADFDEIPTKTSEIFGAATTEKNAAETAMNKPEMKEHEVWKRVAIEVGKRGVPVEIIQKHESKIASCIIDTVIDELKAEQKRDQDAATNPDMLPAPETRSAALTLSETFVACAWSVKLDENPVNEGYVTLTDDNMLKTPTQAIKLRPFSSSSSSSFTSGIEALPEEVASGLQGLCQSCTSYLKRNSCRVLLSQAGTGYLTPDSSVHSEGETEGEDSSSSKVTSLNDDADQGEGLCREEWTEAVQMTKAGTKYAIDDFAMKNAFEVDKESLDGNDIGENEDEDESTDDEDEDATYQQDQFVDRGGFDTWTILNVLGNGNLDDLRMLRLKEGFLKLLEQC